jgi:hypothetical protein
MANSGAESESRSAGTVSSPTSMIWWNSFNDVVQVNEFPWAEFPHKVALHTSCSAVRGLFMQSMSERVNDPPFSKPERSGAEHKGY